MISYINVLIILQDIFSDAATVIIGLNKSQLQMDAVLDSMKIGFTESNFHVKCVAYRYDRKSLPEHQ